MERGGSECPGEGPIRGGGADIAGALMCGINISLQNAN